MLLKFIETSSQSNVCQALRDGGCPYWDIGKWDRLFFLAMNGSCHFTRNVYEEKDKFADASSIKLPPCAKALSLSEIAMDIIYVQCTYRQMIGSQYDASCP
jgi:hypothetical protein